MAGKGRLPIDPELRRRRNRPPELDLLPAASARRTIRLPRFYESEGSDGELRRVEFTPVAREWWRAMVNSPMASRWIETDFAHLRALVVLVDCYYRRPTPITFAEIRRGAASLGATWADRQSLKVRVMTDGSSQSSLGQVVRDSDRVAVLSRYRRAAGDVA